MRYTEGRFIDSQGRRFFYRSWRPRKARAVFVLFHALGLHSGRYRWFCEELSDRGFTCYAVDMHGHGLSDGPRGGTLRGILSSAEKFLNLVRSKYDGSKLVVAGHGCGALVASEVLRPAEATLVMLAPVHEIEPYSRRIRVLKLMSVFGARVKLHHRPLYDASRIDALLEVEEDNLVVGRARARLVLGFVNIAKGIASRGARPSLIIKDDPSAPASAFAAEVEVIYDPRREQFPFDSLLGVLY